MMPEEVLPWSVTIIHNHPRSATTNAISRLAQNFLNP
jgi:hypothetical protein